MLDKTRLQNHPTPNVLFPPKGIPVFSAKGFILLPVLFKPNTTKGMGGEGELVGGPGNLNSFWADKAQISKK